MAEIIGYANADSALPKGLTSIGGGVGLSWTTVSRSSIELSTLQDATGFALVWGGRPATVQDTVKWARTLLAAAAASEPLAQLAAGPQLLHSGVAVSFQNRRMLLVSGCFGLFPVYWLDNGQGLWFTNYPGLLVGRTQLQPDEIGLAQLLMYGHCLGTTTATRGLAVLEPSEVLGYDLNRHQLTRFGRFSPHVMARGQTGGTTKPAELAEKLKQTALSCVEDGATLLQATGGLDSRLLLAAVKERPLSLVTFGAPEATDVEIARQLAGLTQQTFIHLDTTLTEDQLDVWAKTVALASGGEKSLDNAHTLLPYTAYPQWAGQVLLNGNSGEFTRAYWYDLGELGRVFGLTLPGGLSNKLVVRYVERRMRGRAGQALFELLRPEHRTALNPDPATALRNTLAQFTAREPVAALLDDFYIDVRNHRFVMLGLQLGGLYFERAHPYSDARLMSELAQLPLNQRLDSRFHQAAIGCLAPELLDVVWDKTGRPLGEGFKALHWMPERWKLPSWRSNYRPVPYVNYSELFRTNWRSWLGDMVAAIAQEIDPWIPAEMARQLRDDHLARRFDRTRELGALLTFGLWVQAIKAPADSVAQIRPGG
jgi:hypothetical protein